MKATLPVVVTLLAYFTAAVQTSSEWHWTWSCQSGKCKRSQSPVTYPILYRTTAVDSLALCRLTCGTYGSLWPHPKGPTKIGSEIVPFHPKRVRFSAKGGNRAVGEFLATIWELFFQNLLLECGNNCDNTAVPDQEVVVQIQANSPDLSLNLNTDESYTLEVSNAGSLSRSTATIRAETVYGVRHGLETLSQLIARGGPKGGPLYLATNVQLNDAPVYKHRGLMLDTARNYLPLSAIRRTLDAMASCKLNVMHWHATDSQSFPLDFPRVPQLARFGAYSSREVYTMSDVRDVLEYARFRGVRVIMEIDAPSHSGNGWQWGQAAGLGKLAVCVNQQPWRKYCIQPPCGQLNPINPNLYRVLAELYKDVIDVFPRGEMFHMGGDEVFFACWNSTDEIVKWMESQGQSRSDADFLELWATFQSTALRTLDDEAGHSDTPVILWSSHLTQPTVIEKYLPKDRYIIESWVEAKDPLPKDLLAKGYRIIYAVKDKWYLDHGFWATTKYHDWRVVYDCKIGKEAGVLGGEAAMWGERVDAESLDAKVWPRAAALAERLWTNPEASTSQNAEPRFYAHRARLLTRGVHADAVTPEYCVQNDGECLNYN